MPPNNTLLGMTTAEPVSTDVHSNINDLMVQSDLDNQFRQYSMSAYKTPQPITGTAPDIALNPLLAAKKIPSLMKLLKKVNLKNPIYHHTNVPKAEKILRTGKIKPTSSFPTAIEEYSKKIDEFGNYIPVPKAFSVTRDPKFLSRSHSNIGTDVRFIMDRDELIKKGYKMKPFAERGFKKTPHKLVSPEDYKKIHGYYRDQMNPRFEFEERILGSLPTKDIKLIDWTKIPIEYGTTYASGKNFLRGARKPTPELENLINTVIKANQQSTQLPVIMSEQVRNTLKKVQPYLMDMYPGRVKALEKLMSSPTYKYNPFKGINTNFQYWKVGDPKVQLKKFKEYQKMVEKTNPK